MNDFQSVVTSSLSLPVDSYIYSLTPARQGLGVISSDDSLYLLDRETLTVLPGGHIPQIHDGVTCLKGFDDEGNILATAGHDGGIKFWDLRSKSRAIEFKNSSDVPILSLCCSSSSSMIAGGTEFKDQESAVVIWDIRSPSKPQLRYSESHNDDITDLRFHPTNPSLLVSGSTDGLVNIYDTAISDEEEALRQTINHGSSIHRSKFLTSHDLLALSHDEVLSIYHLSDLDGDEDPAPSSFGDLREKLACEYVVDVINDGGDGALIAVGSHSEKRLDLIPLRSQPEWSFDRRSLQRLPGAHGEEIVRSIYIDSKSETVYTAGEDGHVRAWKPSSTKPDQGSKPSYRGSISKRRKSKKDRFQPY